MRLLAFLFGLYILFLGMVPCADGTACNDQVEALTTNHGGNKHTEHKKQCTPFCTCSCCQSNTTITPLQSVCHPVANDLTNKPKYIYLVAAAKDVAIDLLRPPCMIA